MALACRQVLFHPEIGDRGAGGGEDLQMRGKVQVQ